MEETTYSLIKRSVKSLYGINLDDYKEAQMQRRLDSWLVRSGAGSWPEYFKRVQADEPERARFRDYFTINVSEFFRDPERWEELRQRVLPGLLGPARRLRLWSAGCSIGPEPYSLAMLLGELPAGGRHSLLATDLDRGALARARAGGPFSADDVRNVTPTQRARYFRPGGPPFFVAPELARNIEFREQNLFAEEFAAGYDLIVCRNVVIYFTDSAKTTLYRKFHDALRPGGVLFVGGTEIVPRASEIGFRSYGNSFYQRL